MGGKWEGNGTHTSKIHKFQGGNGEWCQIVQRSNMKWSRPLHMALWRCMSEAIFL